MKALTILAFAAASLFAAAPTKDERGVRDLIEHSTAARNPRRARHIDSIRFLSPEIALVEARAHHATHTYVCVKRRGEWLVGADCIHHDIDPKVRPTG